MMSSATNIRFLLCYKKIEQQKKGMSSTSSTTSVASVARHVENKFPAHVVAASREKIYNSVDYGLFATMGQISKYSCLMPWQIPQSSAAILAGCNAVVPSYIIDAGAHIGCDTVHLARLFPCARISAIEIDPETFRCLKMNVDRKSVLGSDEWRVDVYCGDAQELIPKLTAENRARSLTAKIMIYFDPPWGGPEYKRSSALKLFFGKKSQNISEYALELLTTEQCDLVLLKVPFNFDFDNLSTLVRGSETKTPEQVVFSVHEIKKVASGKEVRESKEISKGGVRADKVAVGSSTEYFLVLLQKLKKLSL